MVKLNVVDKKKNMRGAVSGDGQNPRTQITAGQNWGAGCAKTVRRRSRTYQQGVGRWRVKFTWTPKPGSWLNIQEHLEWVERKSPKVQMCYRMEKQRSTSVTSCSCVVKMMLQTSAALRVIWEGLVDGMHRKIMCNYTDLWIETLCLTITSRNINYGMPKEILKSV